MWFQRSEEAISDPPCVGICVLIDLFFIVVRMDLYLKCHPLTQSSWEILGVNDGVYNYEKIQHAKTKIIDRMCIKVKAVSLFIKCSCHKDSIVQVRGAQDRGPG